MSEKVNQEATKATKKVTAIFKPEKNNLIVKGILSNFRFSSTKFNGDREYYQVSVKTDGLTPELVAEIKSKYFSETKDKYLPSFIKDVEENGCKEPIYINLKSQYEFGTFTPEDGNRRYSYDEVIEMGEGLAPNGSEVTLSIRLKEGSAYPIALRIDKLNKQDASDFFE